MIGTLCIWTWSWQCFKHVYILGDHWQISGLSFGHFPRCSCKSLKHFMVMTCNAFYMFVLITVIVLVMAALTNCQDNKCAETSLFCFFYFGCKSPECLYYCLCFLFLFYVFLFFMSLAWFCSNSRPGDIACPQRTRPWFLIVAQMSTGRIFIPLTPKQERGKKKIVIWLSTIRLRGIHGNQSLQLYSHTCSRRSCELKFNHMLLAGASVRCNINCFCFQIFKVSTLKINLENNKMCR